MKKIINHTLTQNEPMEFRPMRRFKQQLTAEECEQILKKAYRGYLSVQGEGGYPYTIPVNFVYTDGHLYFHSAASGHKMDAIRRCPKACFTVIDEPVREENDWWFHVRSVICFGQIGVLEDAEMRIERLRQLGMKYFPEGYDLAGELTHNGPRVVVLDLEIEHMTGKRVKEN